MVCCLVSVRRQTSTRGTRNRTSTATKADVMGVESWDRTGLMPRSSPPYTELCDGAEFRAERGQPWPVTRRPRKTPCSVSPCCRLAGALLPPGRRQRERRLSVSEHPSQGRGSSPLPRCKGCKGHRPVPINSHRRGRRGDPQLRTFRYGYLNGRAILGVVVPDGQGRH